MNYDEFAFFNQQLASLLREDIPLEGALKQLGASLNSEPLRTQVQALAEDLARGTPLPDALAHRDLPIFYRRMVEIGARSNDLPGMLNLLADHYQRANTLWVRLKGLMVYPVIVVVAALCLTLILAVVFSHFLTGFFEQFQALPWFVAIGMWAPPLVLGALTVV